MIPYKTSITLDRTSKQPLYIQLTNQFIALIKSEVLKPKAKLPSSRLLAGLIQVHRKTVVATYDELVLQGWIKTIPQKGTFVNADLPLLKSQKISKTIDYKEKNKTGFSFKKQVILDRTFPQAYDNDYMYINDGVPDQRLAPVAEIAILYRKLVGKKSTVKTLGYGTTYGNLKLRETLVDYLNNTRGLQITTDNLMITRGSQMGMFLTAQLLINNGDYIIIGETNYSSLDTTFEYANAKILRVKVDSDGLNTNAIETLCKTYPVKAIYTTSHHHHPTTVTLSAKRRLELLNLASTYNFAILEDDYDYDFHYNHAPILPLASHDKNGNVIYIGSVCKAVAPVFRVGYLVASKTFVDECAKLRRFIDRQGDALLEQAFASFIKEGSLDRHLKKIVKVYKTRRNLFCKLLRDELSDYFSFETPKGGMAVWVTLHNTYSWAAVETEALKQKVVIPEWQRYDAIHSKHNAIRMGFAAYNETEIYELVRRLKKVMAIIGG